MPTKKKPAIPVDNPNGEITPEVESKLSIQEQLEADRVEAEPLVSKSAAKRVATQKAAPVAKEEVPANLPPVIFESIDGRKLSVSIGRFFAEGRRIEVPREYEGEVERLLKEGHYLITKIA